MQQNHPKPFGVERFKKHISSVAEPDPQKNDKPNPGPHQSEKQDPDPEPYQSKKPEPDPLWSQSGSHAEGILQAGVANSQNFNEDSYPQEDS